MGSEVVKKRKVGRPPKVLSNEQVIQVEALAATLSTEQIADYFGIDKGTFYNMMDRQPEIYQRYKKGKSQAVGSVAKSLLSQALAGNTTAIIFYLKTQGMWKETQGIEHSNPDGSLRPTVIELVVPDDDDTDSTAP